MGVTALSYVGDGQLMSGSSDNSLIIWSLYESSNYSHKQVLTGHSWELLE